MGKAFQLKAKILAKKFIGKEYFRLDLGAKQIAGSAQPGQFVQIKINDSDIPLLRRPLGIHQVYKDGLSVLCQVVGEGTKILSQKKVGDCLDIIGPLGNGFGYRAQASGHGPQILVAGGMGVAPLTFLAEKLTERKTQSVKRKNIVLIGAKTKSQVLCEKEFNKLGYQVIIATDDGSRGFKGYVSGLLKKVLRAVGDLEAGNIYACGPQAMLREVSKIAQKHDLPAQVSLEAHMACGIGACLGCVMKVKSQKSKAKSGFEYKRVCKDGPVFLADEIAW